MKYRHILKKETGVIEVDGERKPYKQYILEQISDDGKTRYTGKARNMEELAQDCIKKGSRDIEISSIETIPSPQISMNFGFEILPCTTEELREFRMRYLRLEK